MNLLATIAVGVSLQITLCNLSIASERMDDGRIAYEAKCASCHDSGKDGAPRANQPSDWENRSELWDAVLLRHAENGYLAMPAKGGDPSMSDYDVGVAAEYLLNLSHPNFPQD